jgi:hypothetical protein
MVASPRDRIVLYSEDMEKEEDPMIESAT